MDIEKVRMRTDREETNIPDGIGGTPGETFLEDTRKTAEGSEKQALKCPGEEPLMEMVPGDWELPSEEALRGSGPEEALCGSGPEEALCGSGPEEALCGSGPEEALCGNGPEEALCGSGPEEALCGSGPEEALCGSSPESEEDWETSEETDGEDDSPFASDAEEAGLLPKETETPAEAGPVNAAIPQPSQPAIRPGGRAAVSEAMLEAADLDGKKDQEVQEVSHHDLDHKSCKWHRGAIIAGFIALVLMVFGIAYAVVAQNYEDHFFKRSYINGIDVGGMTLDEAEETLRRSVEDYSLTVDLMGGRSYTIKAVDFDYTFLPGHRLSKLLKAQNKFFWGKGLFKDSAYEIETPASYSIDKLTKYVRMFDEVRGDDVISPRDARMYYTRGGRFAIIPEISGNEIDADALVDAVLDVALHNRHELNAVETEGIYKKPSLFADDPVLNERVDHLNSLFSVSISYELPEGAGTATYGASELEALTGLDETGTMYRDISDAALDESIRSFVAGMAETDWASDKLPFNSTDLGTRYYDLGTTWGHVLNQDAIVREMKACFASGCGGARDLTYSFKRSCPESIGDTYLEVDIPTQMVYYYVDGEINYCCGCVSGREYDRSTPTGIYSIINKSREIYLEGDYDETGKPGYRSFVNFWMKFYGGYGLHDASWRSNSQFGTSVYLYDGSHGCVNLSYSAAKYLYENVPTGTTVLIVR